ncbi:hypothetical protein [Marinoscillum pacificum]|nr:hypothetical protein [Marinoscillum pacificum]|tara:strand:+ start:404 stop:529 length:126 start_codon:yes stop_codon:yes gene_type:complete
MKIQLTTDQLKLLTAAADRVGLTVNEYISKAIIDHLERRVK